MFEQMFNPNPQNRDTILPNVKMRVRKEEKISLRNEE
jgi:hypothetical protein